jgi:hypothetical protein
MHRRAPRTEVGVEGVKNLLVQFVLLQQMAQGQDPGISRIRPLSNRCLQTGTGLDGSTLFPQ